MFVRRLVIDVRFVRCYLVCRYDDIIVLLFCFKQKTAYEMRMSDWSSDVCSSDLDLPRAARPQRAVGLHLWPRRRAAVRNVPAARPLFVAVDPLSRSEERRVGKSVSVRVDLGGRRIINKKKKTQQYTKPRKLTTQPTYHAQH